MRWIFLAVLVTPLASHSLQAEPQARPEPLSAEAQEYTLESGELRAARYARQASGRLTVSPDGTPSEIELRLDEPRLEALFQRIIARWRFAPMIRDGVPASVRVDMNLELFADHIPDSQRMRYGVSDVLFLKGSEGDEVELLASDFKPPAFPLNMARQGLGARIMVLLQVDDEGKVTRAAVADADLFAVRTSSQRAAAAQVERFAEATLDVVDEWVLAKGSADENGMARVPVHFAPPGTTSTYWTPVLPMAVSRLEWMPEIKDASAVCASGQAIDPEVRLLTSLDGGDPAPAGSP